MSRKCETCVACCVVLGVAEIDKPQWVSCSKLCGSGCGIYETRPGSCRSFECLWLTGSFFDNWRPDILGLMFTKGKTLPGNGGEVLVAHEASEGAASAGEGKRAIQFLLVRGKSVVIAWKNQRRFVPATEAALVAFRSVANSPGRDQ